MPQLPSPEEALNLLRETGEMLSDDFRRTELTGIFRTDSDGNRVPVVIDTRVIPVIKELFTADSSLQTALKMHGAVVKPINAIEDILATCIRRGIVWGFSGFATPSKQLGGGDYKAEAEAMERVYGLLSGSRKPQLVIDGGVSAGVLGLSGVLGTQHGVETLGVVPRKGLGHWGPRTRMIVWGNTYQDREKLVGALPDILICVGGADGTMRECIQAIKQGSIVIILAPRIYKSTSLSGSYMKNKLLRDTENKQLFFCGPDESISACIEKAIRAHIQIPMIVRLRRLAHVKKLLKKNW